MNKIDDILGQLIRKRDAYNDTMKIIHDLQNDPYFVFFASDSDRMGDDELEEVNVWFFDNDIVRKFESTIIDIPGMGTFAVSGFRFRNTESAMAFKLKWT